MTKKERSRMRMQLLCTQYPMDDHEQAEQAEGLHTVHVSPQVSSPPERSPMSGSTKMEYARSSLFCLLLLLFIGGLLSGCQAAPTGADEAEAKPQPPASSAIAVSSEAQANLGLKIGSPVTKNETEYLRVTGTVQAIDNKIGDIRPLSKGRVIEVSVRVGDRVAAGQALATFDNLEAVELLAQHGSARAELQRYKVQQAAAQRILERNRRLAAIGAVPQKDVELSEAEAQEIRESIRAQESVLAGVVARLQRLGIANPERQTSSLTTIRSPFAGVLMKQNVSVGAVADSDTILFSVADLSEVWVQAEVYEKDLGRLHVGQSARVLVDAYPDAQFAGKVTYISDMLELETRTAKVRCEIANDSNRLKLGMFAWVELPTYAQSQALVVPTLAVQHLDGKPIVFVPTAAGEFSTREVRIGSVANGQTEVLSGLSAGEQLVTEGAFHLKAIALSRKTAE